MTINHVHSTLRASESELVSLAQKGDSGAFEQLVELYEGRIRSFFALQLKDPAQAEDLSQDTFVLAYQRLQSFDNSFPFYPWLKGIALNVLRNDRRRRKPESLNEEWAWALQSAHAGPFEDYDVLQALRMCVQKLEGPARELVTARYLEGLSLTDVAAHTGRDPHSLSMALVRIRGVLRDCMTESLENAR